MALPRARLLVVVLVSGLAYPQATMGQTIGPIAFDEPELPLATVIDGLTITTLDGQAIPTLSFTFAVGGAPSSGAVVSDIGFSGHFYSTPLITGPTSGIVTIDFGAEVTRVAFGFGLDTNDAVAGGCIVTAFASDASPVGSLAVNVPADQPYSETRVVFDPPGWFRSVSISFSRLGPVQFGLDNLEYDQVPPPIPALSPRALATLAMALAALAVGALRRFSP